MSGGQFIWFVVVGSAILGLLIFIAGKVKDIAAILDERMSND